VKSDGASKTRPGAYKQPVARGSQRLPPPRIGLPSGRERLKTGGDPASDNERSMSVNAAVSP